MPTRKPGPGKPDQPKRGRPPRTLEQREAAKERRITQSVKGRLKFRPGDKHALDVQMKEARNYRALIAAQLESLQATQAALNELDDPGVMVSREEHALKAFLWEEYQEHKHRDHIAATFLAIRRQRLLARLQAANDALQIARDLLTPNDTLVARLACGGGGGPPGRRDPSAAAQDAAPAETSRPGGARHAD